MLQLEFISGTVVVQPEPVDKKGTFRGPEFRSKKKEKKESTLGVCFVVFSYKLSCFHCYIYVSPSKGRHIGFFFYIQK